MTFYENNGKYISTLLMVCICLPYLQMILMVTNVDLNIQIYIWIITISIMAFCFAYLPLREYLRHQIPTMGRIFTVGPVMYLNYTSRSKVFGFEKEIEEIKIDWTNKGLRVLEASRIFLRGKRAILKKESKIEKESRQQIEPLEAFAKIIAGLNIPLDSPKLEQLAQVLGNGLYKDEIESIEESKKVKKRKKALMKTEETDGIKNEMDEYNRDLALVQFEPEPIEIKEKKKEPTLKYPEMPTLEDLGILEDKQMKYLQSLHYYKTRLYHPENLEGYGFLTFDQAFLMLPDIFSKSLATSEMHVYDYDDYLVRVQGSDTMWVCHGFVKGKIPLLHLFATENCMKPQMDENITASVMKHSTLYHLRIKIYEWIINKLSSEQDPFNQEITRLEDQNEGLRDRFDYLVQEYASDTFVRQSIDVQKENSKLREELAGLKKWKIFSYILAILSIILILGLVIGIIPLSNPIDLTPP